MLFPLIVRFPVLKYALMIASFAVFCAASFHLIPPVEWAYKYLPGTLWIFILVSVMYDLRSVSAFQEPGFHKTVVIATAGA